MAVSLFFGLPGCGKTTLLTAKAIKAVKSGRYCAIYSNVHIAVPGVTFIDNDCIGKFDLRDCLILIDEGTLFADNRGHKEFGKDKISFFLLHRHYNCDIIIFTQQWDGVDKKIRVITDRVYYVYKGFLLGRWITSYYRIPYGIIIPDPKKANGEKLGDIVQGYCKPNFLIRLLSPKIFRPRYYQYFDSWEAPPLPILPLKYQVYCPEKIPESKPLFCCVARLQRIAGGGRQRNAYGPRCGPQNNGFVSFGSGFPPLIDIHYNKRCTRLFVWRSVSNYG